MRAVADTRCARYRRRWRDERRVGGVDAEEEIGGLREKIEGLDIKRTRKRRGSAEARGWWVRVIGEWREVRRVPLHGEYV